MLINRWDELDTCYRLLTRIRSKRIIIYFDWIILQPSNALNTFEVWEQSGRALTQLFFEYEGQNGGGPHLNAILIDNLQVGAVSHRLQLSLCIVKLN